jgi:hypothetical protein
MPSFEDEINDIRPDSHFRGITFSGFKKGDVRKGLIDSFIDSKIEPACYWSAELICAGHYSELWDIILFFYSKYIHLGNPKLAVLIDMRIQNFKEMIQNGYAGFEIKLRNNDKMRKLFCEIVCILCETERRHSFDEIIIKKEDLIITTLVDRLKAPTRKCSENVFQKEDPKDIFIAVNELCYHVSKESRNTIQACYWMEWIMEFDFMKKTKKEKFDCERRITMPVETKHQKDIVWIVWDIFFKEVENQNALTKKIMSSLLNLFCLRYTNTSYKKRKFIMYMAISLLTEPLNLTEEMLKETTKQTIAIVTSKIDFIYKQIKPNEVSPKTDYLFKDIKQNNLEKTIEKLEKMNSFGEKFIPQI